MVTIIIFKLNIFLKEYSMLNIILKQPIYKHINIVLKIMIIIFIDS